jgi:hypothetical protein
MKLALPHWCPARNLLFALAANGVLLASSTSQSLIPNGDFESGLAACAQGYLPAPWFQGGVTSPGADTYSCLPDPCDPSSMLGIAISSFGNFTTASPAPSGVRFAAGWSATLSVWTGEPESFGVPLAESLEDGSEYRVAGMFTNSKTHGLSGYFEVFLSDDTAFDDPALPATVDPDVSVAVVGIDAPRDVWAADEAEFVAPSGASSLAYLIVVPRGIDYYAAIDDLILESAEAAETYCTAGTSASGCQAAIAAVGVASATAPAGFDLLSIGVEGAKDGLFFFGTNGRQANPWGNGTSFQCVVPPVKRGGVLSGTGTTGACNGSFGQDLNALWCPTCPKPGHNPGAGALVQAQLWYRDPQSTSNQTTSLSDAVEFSVIP